MATNINTKQKLGLFIFFLTIIVTFIMGSIYSVDAHKIFKSHTFEELTASAWNPSGFLFIIWSFSIPLCALFAMLGVLIYSKVKTRTVILMSCGLFLIYLLVTATMFGNRIPILFGIVGTIILIIFFGILWNWSKKRPLLIGKEQHAADLQLIGYALLLAASWFSCGEFSRTVFKALDGMPGNPFYVQLYIALSWLFFFLSSCVKAKSVKESKSLTQN